MSSIRLLSRKEIDPRRWNGCVYYALNSRAYAYTWYLDNVCEEWFGLVENEYESVFPVVWKYKKYIGYKEIFQPPLTQQLGLFSMHVCSPTRLKWFIDALPADIRRVDMQLNFDNSAVQALQGIEGWSVSQRPNFVLPLSRPYADLAADYSSNLRRKLRKGEKNGLFCSADIRPETFVDHVRAFHTKARTGLPESFYHTALRIIYAFQHRGQGNIFVAYDENKQFHAAVFLMVDGARLVNLINVSSEAGRESDAMSFLIDNIIRTHAGQLKMLDFEGSAIEGIAQFYQSFGAINQPYYRLEKNALSWWQRLFVRG